MKRTLFLSAILGLAMTAVVSAGSIVHFSGLSSAKIKAGINAVMFGDNPACYPRDLAVTIGLIDYTAALDPFFVENQLTNDSMIWNSGVGTLAPGALSFAYSMTAVIPGADVFVAVPGDPYEIDITPVLFQAALAQENIPYAICVMADSGHAVSGGGFIRDSGKINLQARPGLYSHDELIGVEVTDASGTRMFKYKKSNGNYDSNAVDRIQYVSTHNNYNGQDGAGFAVGGWWGSVAPDTSYKGIAERRCSFIFHRGLAATLGWLDPEYPNDVHTPAVENGHVRKAAGLQLFSSPNPFTGSTRIAFALDRESSVRLAVYDVNGRLLRTIESGVRQAGVHTAAFDGTNLSAGICLLRLTAGERTLNRKMLITK